MDAPRPRDDLAHRGDVGLLFGLALDDQVAFPDLEPEGPGDRPVVVADSHREDEVGLVLPRELEFDHRPGGELEVAADRGPVLVGPRLSLLLTPRLDRRGLAPARQAVRPEVDQVGARVPAVHPVDRRTLDVDPADPRDLQHGLVLVQPAQRAVQDVPSRQLETVISLGSGQGCGHGEMDGIHCHLYQTRTGPRTTSTASESAPVLPRE